MELTKIVSLVAAALVFVLSAGYAADEGLGSSQAPSQQNR